MLKIAMVDDERLSLDLFAGAFRQAFAQSGEQTEIFAFVSPETFFATLCDTTSGNAWTCLDAASPGDAQESGTAPAGSASLSVFNIPLEDWIDGQEVMQRLHISARTLQTLRSNGTLPHTRIRNKIYYRRQDIQRILAGHYGKKKEGGEDGRH